jgi:hypothetical protein
VVRQRVGLLAEGRRPRRHRRQPMEVNAQQRHCPVTPLEIFPSLLHG